MKKIFALCSLLFLFAAHTEAQSTTDIIKIAAVGNSITEGPGRENPDSYPLIMQELLGEDYEVKNYGIGGRTLLKKGDLPYWNEPQFKEVLAYAPDILIIKLGTNDSKPQNWKHKKDFENDYIELINTFKSSMPDNGKVYICIPVPVMEDNWGINEHTMREEMAPMLQRVADKTGSKIIDLHYPLKERNDLFPDGVHPNKEGLSIMAGVIAQEIKGE
ncbi:GDSL-type esterase/lipase family protein [Anditalea andensis]|uniref:Sialate O-acetylesterase n=1 Tax=Anditalea andensis TaxID=1048983 RepID=A0A074LH02_9BACT|nr:GDSL-type esterase/lipase family protein [Anditalea andensis]KEO73057.1 sialate O-acetylesterase [Anditalea andensis]